MQDQNKGITSILYNHLNLPTEVQFGATNKITYFYDATGIKMKKQVIENENTTTTEYAGNYIYEDNELKFFNHPEGYIEPTVTLSGAEMKYVYQYKDHLGNIRLSYKNISTNDTPILEIVEENNYYPFGLKHKGYNNVVTSTNIALKRKFGGKEFNDELWGNYGVKLSGVP